MSARAPTEFTLRDNDKSLIIPRKKILTTVFNNTIDDQHFFLMKNDVALSTIFNGITGASGPETDDYFEVHRFYSPLINRCGNGALSSGTQETFKFCVLLTGTLTPGVGTAANVRLVNLTTSDVSTNNVTTGITAKTWRGFFNTICMCNGDINEFSLQAKAVNGLITIFGLGIFGNYGS